MEQVRFGHTGLKVSKLGLGTMSLGASAWKGWVLDADRAVPILERALEAGITFFDMADWYSLGENERLVGRVLLERAPRERLVLASKVFYPMSEAPNDRGLSRAHLMAAIDASLARIGADYLDLWIVHAFDPATPVEETMAALHDIVRAGKVRYLGASTMYAWQFAAMNAAARANGWTEFVNMQCQLSLLYREEEREMLPLCRAEGIAVTTFSPLARGYLAAAGKTDRVKYDPFLDWFGDAVDRDIAGRVGQLARRRGLTPSHIAMAWVAGHPDVTTPLVGADAPGHVDVAVEAAGVELTADERAFLEEAYRPADVINDYVPVRRPRAAEGAETARS
ncbi:MAG TPA: aldo/keto reductase [Caulobacteraceae bacterium]|nr:aldo/keto reductase [Caulobacteraceae bacterium]